MKNIDGKESNMAKGVKIATGLKNSDITREEFKVKSIKWEHMKSKHITIMF